MRLTITRALLPAALLALTQGMTPGTLAAGRACYTKYHATCFGGSQVTAAEHAMAVAPVNPTRAVTDATHLPLVQVVVERNTLPHPTGTVITYSYGVAVAIDRPLSKMSRPALFVTEFVLPQVKPYSGVTAQPGTIPSMLATFPHRKLALLVAGQFPLTTLRSIALSILKK